MQMRGQRKIPAPSRRIWDSLYDPDILKRCIPGCQSVTRESDERMRAIAEIKIGPIGARFDGTVTLSDIDPPNGCTLTIEGRGGTVGVVKAGARVRLADDNWGGTLLSYEVDAEVGGRLAQLGGPLIDATAKQLAAKFFEELGSVLGTPAGTAVSTQAAASASSRPEAAPLAGFAAPSSRFPVAWGLALVVAALIGYLIGHAQRGSESDWMGLAVGLLLLIVATAAFELGRRAASPVVIIDPALLARLSEQAKR